MTCLLGTGKSSTYFGLWVFFFFSCGLNWFFFSTGNHCIGAVCCSCPEESHLVCISLDSVLGVVSVTCWLHWLLLPSARWASSRPMHLFSPTRITTSLTWTFPRYDAVKRHGLQEKISETAGQVLYYEQYVLNCFGFFIKNLLSTQIWLASIINKLSYFDVAWVELWHSTTLLQ